ncbi:MAG: 3-oxoadipate enol-lactonase [Rhodospirillales bacterium]|nr:3-oxoadipate enol-lactonase [Rhodospirillales bacterium]MBO6788837.1 3-oxoadipate enol-lactonase [Rhodospirillales bacterium]
MKLERQNATIEVLDEGPEDGPVVVFANSLGTALSLWDKLCERLPSSLRRVRFDLRGHGGSSVPDEPFGIEDLVGDAEGVMDALGIKDAAFVGLSIGGMIAQGLASKRPDLVRVAVFSNTAAKIGDPDLWNDRIRAIEAQGLEGIADGVMERWFGEDFRATDEVKYWRQMLVDTDPQGYIGCCRAIAGADLRESTAALRLPVLGIAGTADLSTPPDVVRETVATIPGSRFEVIEGAGHLPCVEAPDLYANLIMSFLKETDYV